MWEEFLNQKRTTINDLKHLSESEKLGVSELTDFISSTLCLSFHAILFGSKARGDYDENSDVDVMIILEQSQCTPEIKKLIRKQTREINNSKVIYMTPLISNFDDLYNPCKWGGVFRVNVTNEGVLVCYS